MLKKTFYLDHPFENFEPPGSSQTAYRLECSASHVGFPRGFHNVPGNSSQMSNLTGAFKQLSVKKASTKKIGAFTMKYTIYNKPLRFG